MSEDILVLLCTLGAATIAGGVTYYTQRRTSKGTVQTSEASDLWKEANEIRQWQSAEIITLRAELVVLRDKSIHDEATIRQKELIIAAKDAQLRSLGVANGDT